jgi:hypothetical protein
MIVILGCGNDDKPHAARFELSDLAAARRAAAMMNFRLGKATTDRALALAKNLPEGKIFAPGKGLLPLVKSEIFDELTAHLDFELAGDPPGCTPAAEDLDPQTRSAVEQLWGQIKAGSQVLVFEQGEGRYPHWCAAIVTAVSKDKETLTVRWRDYYGWGVFPVNRSAVAVLPPASE